ncbi:hypothetical protein [Haladaptatus sp. DYSN1]|uniref:hypothetical protein n=1 Tax=unclassified Haladaptatus TaxID=2622732 RepID=UPI0024055309|nr:hypothetical protein [Haladaptatus sp. DYSN1]
MGRFTWRAAGPYDESDRDLASRIVTEGAVTTEGFALSTTGRNVPAYLEQEGNYYEVRVRETGTVTRTRWLLWFDRIDGQPPADAETYTSSLGLGNPTPLDTTHGLSELDIHAVETAEGRMAPEYGFIDLEDEPPEHRGHLFLRRSADETDLVPAPPFTHVVFESGDGTVYARAVVEEVSVELAQYEHEATRIADSEAAYRAYLDDTYLETTFWSEDLTDEQQSLLDSAQGGLGYEETVPLSTDFTDILARLGVDDTPEPDLGRVEFSEEVYFAYDGTDYEAQLEVFG